MAEMSTATAQRRAHAVLRGALLVAAVPVNAVLGILASLLGLAAFDAEVAHVSPAQALPVWMALPYLLFAYLVAGVVSAVWSRKWWVVFPSILVGYFLALGGYHSGVDYYAETIWDELGRPTNEQAAIGAISAVAAVTAWVGARISGRLFWARVRTPSWCMSRLSFAGPRGRRTGA